MPGPQAPFRFCRPAGISYLLSVETNGDGFFYLNLYATQGVYYVFDPIEVNDDVVVYGESGKVFEGLYHEVWATVGESGVYFVLPVARDLHQGIPRNRQNSFAGLCHPGLYLT